jgi:DNA polymerase-3 subunit alpha (Gram-positive type)
MENVRKGKGIAEQDAKDLRSWQVPDWYIDSCQKIKYMFPKAHAVAYVLMAYRIAYCKVHHPQAFYAAYFTIRAADFDADLILAGEEAIKKHISLLKQKGRNISKKEEDFMAVLEVAYEMNLRGIKFCRVDLYKSHPTKFLLTEDGLLPPLTALVGLGKNNALNIAAARGKTAFISQDDLRLKAGVSKPIIELLRQHGCLDDLPDSSQIALF